MTAKAKNIMPVITWVWHHTSAFVAVVLIVVALGIGYRIGSSSKDPVPEITQDDHEPDEPKEYTCSMHPTWRSKDPDSKCGICFMELIPVSTGVASAAGSTQLAISESARAMSRIETARVGRFYPTAQIRLLGKVTQDETAIARLTAYFPGRIERLFVNYLGIPVAEGEHLAEVFSPELLAAFAELRQAHLTAGKSIDMGELMEDLAVETLRMAREKLRLFGLSSSQIEAIEQGEYDSDRLTIYAPIGGVVTHLAVREGDYLKTGDPIATIADLSRLWLDLEAFESQLSMLRWGQLVTFTVEAHPGEVFQGRISFIEPFVDERTRTAAVRVAVDNADDRLKPGMFASAVVRTRVSELGAVMDDAMAGKWVGPMHPTVVEDDPGACDICGMDLVTAESLGVVGEPDAHEMPLVIPHTAVLFTGTRSVVYVEVEDTENPTYEFREIVLGPRAGEFHIVKSGLQEGESVVVNGAFRIDSAMQIEAKPSMMSPSGGGAVGHDHGAMQMPPPEASLSVPEPFLDSLDPVYDAYLRVQESLAADDLGGFLEAAGELKSALESVSETGLAGETLVGWRNASSKLATSQPTTTIEQARASFETMSDGVIELHRRFGHSPDEDWSIAYCPMAFDSAGADWLQRGDTINNPYFGASMLGCGDIVESLPPRDDPGNVMVVPGDEHEGDDDD